MVQALAAICFKVPVPCMLQVDVAGTAICLLCLEGIDPPNAVLLLEIGLDTTVRLLPFQYEGFSTRCEGDGGVAAGLRIGNRQVLRSSVLEAELVGDECIAGGEAGVPLFWLIKKSSTEMQDFFQAQFFAYCTTRQTALA